MARKSKKKAVIFDFDGTIVDSMKAFAEIAGRVMPRHYPVDAETARRLYLETSGIPFFEQIEILFPGNPANAAAVREFEEMKLKGYFSEPLFPDVTETIINLRRKGIKAIVSSNNFQNLVDEFVSRAGIEFDMVLGFADGFSKGEDHFAHIEKKLGVKREDMVFVGDSLKDGERAKASEISFIGKEGIFSKEDFEDKFPDVDVISELADLEGVLGTFSNQ